MAAERFEQAYSIAKFPTIQYDIAQAYRRWYEVEQNVTYLQKAIAAYRMFIAQAPGARQQAVAQKFLAILDVELVGQEAEKPKREAAKLKKFSWDPVTGQAVGVAKTPVYKRWWLWTTIGGVAVAAVAIGAGVGYGSQTPSIDPNHPPGTFVPRP